MLRSIKKRLSGKIVTTEDHDELLIKNVFLDIPALISSPDFWGVRDLWLRGFDKCFLRSFRFGSEIDRRCNNWKLIVDQKLWFLTTSKK
ncbi:hypothetical protein AKJ42_03545 [candidate division MSBL1 archaeon SCGC-AAA261C02]|uniref:Uncharacterized protein n=1 Tax=candidate division MSBL1 archaeon SCGC-AAA261C02 TaxID=1698272 RepID=A0A133UYD7_9EURY|nr:hypothetical protein AKJ42_03545 [candidate division MSBL1 archaeon SCGC-AAA261C02]